MEKAQNKQSSKIGLTIFKIFIVTIQIPINMVLTYFYNTYIEIIICMLAFQSLRYMFPKTYHSNGLLKCMGMTAVIFWTCNIYMIVVGRNVSILINVLIGFLISYIAYLVQDYIDLKERNKKVKSNRDKIIELLSGDTSQDNIFLLCRNCGLKDDVANSVDLFLTNTLEETAEILEVDVRTIQRRIKKFIEECSK